MFQYPHPCAVEASDDILLLIHSVANENNIQDQSQYNHPIALTSVADILNGLFGHSVLYIYQGAYLTIPSHSIFASRPFNLEMVVTLRGYSGKFFQMNNTFWLKSRTHGVELSIKGQGGTSTTVVTIDTDKENIISAYHYVQVQFDETGPGVLIWDEVVEEFTVSGGVNVVNDNSIQIGGYMDAEDHSTDWGLFYLRIMSQMLPQHIALTPNHLCKCLQYLFNFNSWLK